MKQMVMSIPLVLSCVVLFVACGTEGEDGPPVFSSPGDFLDNPYLDQAIDESGFQVTSGDDPPAIPGRYSIQGSVQKSEFPGLEVGMQVNSTFCFYNQTADGEIMYAEKAPNIEVKGSGAFIVGSNGMFTVYGSNRLDYAQLDQDLSGCIQTTTNLITGTQGPDGEINLSSLNTIVALSNCPAELDTMLGSWFMFNGIGTLTGTCQGPSDL